MSRIARSASQALISLAISLSAFTLASAEAPPTRYEYAYCVGIAGNPRVEVFSPVFQRLPESVPQRGRTWFTVVNDKYHKRST